MSTPTSSVTINPGQPAEYQQVLVKPATNPTVSVTLSLHDALVLASLEGGALTYDSVDTGLYYTLCNHPRYAAYQTLRNNQKREGGRAHLDFTSLRAATEAAGV